MKLTAQFILAAAATVTLVAAQTNILKNPGFENGAFGWNFQDDETNVGSIDFVTNAQRARFGSRLAVLAVDAGAVFPQKVRLGQKYLMLKSGRRYRYSVLVRVDSGLEASGLTGGVRGAVVSAFCELGNNLIDSAFTGMDVTVAEANRGADGVFRSDQYRKITFDVIGNGKTGWKCWIGLFGQPFDRRRPAVVSVDAFRLTNVGAAPVAVASGGNLLSAFTSPLKVPKYDNILNSESQFVVNFPNGPGWYREQYLGGITPSVSGNVLTLAMSKNAASESLSGVVRQVRLVAGQVYHMCVDYTRITPLDPPTEPPYTTFNYFVRLPKTIKDTGVRRTTQGLLLGRVDVQVGGRSARSGTSRVKFIAPTTDEGYHVVLRLNEYANEQIKGEHKMTFKNPRIFPIASLDDNAC